MISENGTAKGATGPKTKFRFEVNLGTELKNAAFQEVSGMDVKNQVVEFRQKNCKDCPTVKIPGIAKYGNITLKRGFFVNDNAFWKWYSQINMNTIQRRNILVKLVDEQANETTEWTLTNAFPVKITTGGMRSDADQVAVDTLVIAYEQLMLTNSE